MVPEVRQRSREENCEYFDKHRCHRPEADNHKLSGGDLVLLHDTKVDTSHSHNLSHWWSGLYRIADAMKNRDRGTSRLAELDGMLLEGYFSGDRVKRFVARE